MMKKNRVRIRGYKRRTKKGISAVRAHERRIDFPSPQMQSSSIRIAILVPSTKNIKDETMTITESEFKSRIEETMAFLSKFGGYTSYKAMGGWVDNNGTLVQENVALVESYAKINEYKKLDLEVRNYIYAKKRAWKQSSIGYQFRGKMYFF